MPNKIPIKLLAIDDDPVSLELVSEALASDGLEVLTATDPEEGLELARSERPQVVLVDLMMPKLSGMDLIDSILEAAPATDIVLMTAHYSTESAVEAIKRGACDYLDKPVSLAVLRQRVGSLVEEHRKRLRAADLDSKLLETSQFEGIVGRSPLMWDLFAQIRRVAPHFRNCLVTGATGTGKELVARALHRLGPVSARPFVVCNSAAVVETLVESELFGHVKGAFTGAVQDKPGLFEQANGGMLFLDEIGDMPVATQAKLLRALQNQEIQRVGSLAVRKVDVRVVAATNYDLRDRINEKQFREDLYYRLSMVELRAPLLSQRKEDLPLLTAHFVGRFSEQYGKLIRGLTQRAQIILASHSWPGNVRELENVIGHGCMMTSSDLVDVNDLPPYLRNPVLTAAAPAAPAAEPGDERLSFDERERKLLEAALRDTGGNQMEAARRLGITRDRLRYKVKKFGLR